MRQYGSRKIAFSLIMAGILCAPLSGVDVHAKQPKGAHPQEQKKLTASEAAARAKAQHGGKVLKVTPSGKGYRVKMLKDSGRVVTVMIKD